MLCKVGLYCCILKYFYCGVEDYFHAIAQSELVNLHIPIIGEAQKGIDMTITTA
ncbi:MAG: hypothetical protein NT166_12225 [Candidatus Aminicenantes bacterium]|nr:hypothetical protein [Candidatus Aminicenantes bacterium]